MEHMREIKRRRKGREIIKMINLIFFNIILTSFSHFQVEDLIKI